MPAVSNLKGREVEVAEALGETTFPINPSEASRLQNTDGYVQTQKYYLNETADTNVPVKKYFYNSVQRRYQISGKQRYLNFINHSI